MNHTELSDAPVEQQSTTRRDRIATTVRRHFSTILVLTSVGLNGLALFLIFILTLWIATLANKPAPTLVELSDGSSLSVGARDALARTPASSTAFVAEKMRRLFSWSAVSVNPDTNAPVLDKGVSVSGEGFTAYKVPTDTENAAYALSEDSNFRETFLRQLAPLVPLSVFTGTLKTYLLISHVSDPVVVQPNAWKLDMVATLITFKGNDQVGSSIAFNKTVYVRSVLPPPGEQSPDATIRQIARERRSGLEIYRITDLESH